ncbi:MAG: AAA family ATPase [Parcubacteria group bacterium]|jgi:shikimate kinase
MDLIFIYGQPAVGKLTIAKELKKKTGFTLFHNHLSVDLAKTFFEWGTPEYSQLNKKIMLSAFEAAAKSGQVPNLIFTYGFRPKKSPDFIKKIVRIIKKHGGKVFFFYIDCSQEELLKRVKSPERKKYKKISTIKILKRDQHHWGEIPFVENIKIDNTNLSPKKVAEMILSKLKK